MKKIISLLLIALLSITSILNVNAIDYFDFREPKIEKLYINEKYMLSADTIKQIHNKNGIIYFIWIVFMENFNDGVNYYKYENENLIKITKEEYDNIMYIAPDENWLYYLQSFPDYSEFLKKHIKKELVLYDSKENKWLENIYLDWKLYLTLARDEWGVQWLSWNTLYLSYIQEGIKNHKIFIYDNTKVETIPIQETPKTTQANPQLDKILAPFFERTDKKGDEIAKNTYKTVISKIDIVLQKKLSVKNKNILNYLKEKLEEKIK